MRDGDGAMQEKEMRRQGGKEGGETQSSKGNEAFAQRPAVVESDEIPRQKSRRTRRSRKVIKYI